MGYATMLAVVSTYDYSVVSWMTLRAIGIERIKKWEEDNPMPESKTFRSFEEFLENVERAEGTLIFRKDESDDFLGWIVDLVDELF